MDDPSSKQVIEEVPTSPVRKNIELFESKFGSNFKKRLAPPPPGKQIQLPKIGNYKPKSISTQLSVEKENVNPEPTRDQGFFFGEIVINEKTNDQEVGETDNTNVNGEYGIDNEPVQTKFTENPLFGKNELSSPLVPDEDTSYGPGVDNPVFISPPADYPVENDPIYSTPIGDIPEAPPRKKRSSKIKQAPSPPTSPRSNQRIPEDNELPFIPEPDYEEDVPSKPIQNGRPDEHIYKEYEGEDFSKYLSDEDDGFYETFTGRGKVKYRRKNVKRPQAPPPPRPKSAGPTMKPIKNTLKRQEFKPIGKKDIVNENNKRNTIRDFSFHDSKMGYDINRATKSTSAKGRYAKHGKERPCIETADSSYEEFLRMRHTEDGSNSSADSGHEPGEDSFLNN